MTPWLEKDLEDYVVSHLNDVFGLIIDNPHVTLLGRQVRCRYGIIDLLAYQDSTLFIVELKAVKADDNTAGQLQRYCRAIQHAPLPDRFSLEFLDLYPVLYDFPISLIAIAPAFTDKAAYGVDFCIKTERIVDGFSFERAVWPKGDKEANKALTTILNPYFDSLIRAQKRVWLQDSDGILLRSAMRRMLETN